MRIELNCRDCGGNHFTLDLAVDDQSQINCGDCGHKIGTMGEIKQQVAAEVLKHSGASLPRG